MLQNDEVDFEAFVGTVEASEKKQVEKTATQKGFDVPDCTPIDDYAIVRFVNGIAETALDQGKPGSGRAKLFNIGWVRDDEDKPFFLTLPAIINNKPMYKSTMCEFIDKVLSRTWIANPEAKDGEAKGSWQYFYENRNDYGQQQSGEQTLKQIFWKVFKSGVDPNSDFYKTARTWRGQTVYVANVIDRKDYKWHQENKKTKLLMRKLTVKADRVNRKEVSSYAISSPLKELSDNHGIGLNYDVLIVPGKANNDKFTLKNLTKIKEKDYWDDVKNIVKESDHDLVSTEPGFTAEEKTWEPIDIDKFYRFTSASAILKHFGKTIKNFDMMVGTNFYEQFKEEADAEAKSRKATAAQTTESVAAPATSAPVQPASQPATQPAPQPVAQPAAQVTTQAAPVQASQPAAQPQVQQPTAPSFDTMQPVGAPPEIQPSAEAQQSIDSFYDSLDDQFKDKA